MTALLLDEVVAGVAEHDGEVAQLVDGDVVGVHADGFEGVGAALHAADEDVEHLDGREVAHGSSVGFASATWEMGLWKNEGEVTRSRVLLGDDKAGKAETMGDKTGIEWTDATWNPIRGCSRVSEGCRHCYAETVAGRFSGPGLPYEGLTVLQGSKRVWNGKIRFVEEHLLDPLKWKKPRRIFVNSMSDLFHEGVTDAMLDRIFAVMALCPQHTFQVLTKRPERMLAYLTRVDHYFRIQLAAEAIQRERGKMKDIDRHAHRRPDFISNVWLGVSAEDQKAADARVPLLLQTPAAVRFVSLEPLLGAIDLTSLADALPYGLTINALSDMVDSEPHVGSPVPKLDWVIVGGESGPGARPMHPEWARSLRDQCVPAGVPFFFKQKGQFTHEVTPAMSREPDIYLGVDGRQVDEYVALQGGAWQGMWRVGKKAAGDLLDGVQWHQMPDDFKTAVVQP